MTVEEVLFAHLEAFDTPLPIAWPEQAEAFVPPADGKYLAVSFFANAPRWQGVASGHIDQGLLQIAVVWPKKQGVIAPAAVADALINHFPVGPLADRVKVASKPWKATPIIEPDKVSVPVTVPWTR